MPNNYNNYNNQETRHSDEMQDIITIVPSWLVRGGSACFLGFLVLIMGVSALISYPDVVPAKLKVISSNAPQAVFAREPGRLVKLLVAQNNNVKIGQPLAYFEAGVDHAWVLNLLNKLNELKQSLIDNKPLNLTFDEPGNLKAGKLSPYYQAFFTGYREYKTDMYNKSKYDNATSRSGPLTNDLLRSTGELINVLEDWKSKYILTAPKTGEIYFSGIIHEGQDVKSGEPLFYINPVNSDFFGEITIPQELIGQVKEGQDVIIKLKAYPYQEYGIVKGKIAYITGIPVKDNMYMARVNFLKNASAKPNGPIVLKYGLDADAGIVTKNVTLLSRLLSGFKPF
ncbi:HlyD family efflux transporter periplasmic adaptor subunit [Mucilaginibacter angelicae]|uniref:HlyD family efflux transporter periplasmic adaptor subunit n=1 Tax=Mucilaginibacter angelicae TaxID=869718 RepID=A0ABV6L3E1_9SPHI